VLHKEVSLAVPPTAWRESSPLHRECPSRGGCSFLQHPRSLCGISDVQHRSPGAWPSLGGEQCEAETAEMLWGHSPLPILCSPSPVCVAVHLDAHPPASVSPAPALLPSTMSKLLCQLGTAQARQRGANRAGVWPAWLAGTRVDHPAAPPLWGHPQLMPPSCQNHPIAIGSSFPVLRLEFPLSSSASGERRVLKQTRRFPFPEQPFLQPDLWEMQPSGALGTNGPVTSQRRRKDSATRRTPNVELLIMSQAAPLCLQ